jgi:hypothetical protein
MEESMNILNQVYLKKRTGRNKQALHTDKFPRIRKGADK